MGDSLETPLLASVKYDDPLGRANAVYRATDCAVSVFHNLPLDRTRRTLRLWKFKTDAQDKRHNIHVNLAVFDMEECPSYTALSYTWGTYDNPRTILINGGQLKITENLWHFLLMLRGNSENADRWFWADQISLDQLNVRERDHQVGLMSDIYTAANQVFAYLGPMPSANDLLDAAFSKKRFDAKDPNTGSIMAILFDIFSRPYWTRLWVVQELWLASDVIFWCGQRSIPRNLLRARYNWARLGASESFVYAYVSAPTLSMEFKTLFRDHGKTIDLLLSKSNINRKLDLPRVLDMCCNSLCTDPRDKIYGVQALLKPEDRVAVDYSKSHNSLVIEVIRNIIIREPEPSYRNDWQVWGKPLSWNHIDMRIDAMSQLTRRLQQSGERSCRPTRIMYWACMVARIPEHVQTMSATTRAFQRQIRTFWPYFTKRAITSRQKDFINYLQVLAHRHVFPWTHRDIVLSKHYPLVKDSAGYYRTPPPLEPPPGGWLDAAFVIEQAASQHGFVLYGDYLCHPEDWPLPTEAPSKVFMLGLNT